MSGNRFTQRNFSSPAGSLRSKWWIMRGCNSSIALIFACAVTAGRVSGSDAVGAGVVTRLCQHVKERKVMLVDRSQPEIIWSDGAMFEIAGTFPREVQELISTPTRTQDLHPV